jgi:hypothetical protein
VEHQGGRETFRTCKAADFVVNFVVVGGEFGPVGVLVGAVGEFASCVERELKPLFIGLKFPFVIFRHIGKSEVPVVVIGEKEVQQEYGIVFFVDLFQASEKHGVKDGSRSLPGDVTEKKAAVIKEKVTAFEGFFIPQHSDGQGFFSKIVIGRSGDFVDPFSQADCGVKKTVFSDNAFTVDSHLCLGIGKAFDFDFKVVICFDTVVTVQDGTVPQVYDFKHFLFLCLSAPPDFRKTAAADA